MSTADGTRCTNGTCVDVKVKEDGVHLTSTIVGNDDVLVVTHAEWAAFIPQVKAGEWDHTIRGLDV